MIRSLFILSAVIYLSSCDSLSGKKSTDPCDLYQYLNGSFETDYLEGTMIFSGGMKGTIDIVGVDYNEMDCTYSILDCTTGQADMVCEGAPHKDIILMIAKDTVQIGQSTYTRVK